MNSNQHALELQDVSIGVDNNDNDLIGTAATTAEDNFDETHPLFELVADLSALRRAHPAHAPG